MSFEATIVVPQFNQPQLTCGCLRSLAKHETCRTESIVVDDGSSADCRRQVESLNLADTRVVAQRHRGASSAWNRGAAAASAPFLVFLNNDTLFEGPVVERLLEPLRSRGALLSGPAMRQENALPQSVLEKLPTERFLEGWCFAVSRADFCRLGGFDEAMAVYWSDTDFQARLLGGCRNVEQRIACVAGLPIRHLSHRTARQLPARRRIWRTDRETFLRKWAGQSRL